MLLSIFVVALSYSFFGSGGVEGALAPATIRNPAGSCKCSDINPLLNKLTQDLEDLKGQLSKVNSVVQQQSVEIEEIKELAKNPNSGSGVVVPTPALGAGNWIVLLNRFNGAIDFNRKWDSYRNGFGDPQTSEFWIGNENIHQYTSRPSTSYKLRIEFQALTSGHWYYAEYEQFTVDSEASKYALHVSGFSGNGGDSLTNTEVSSYYNHNGMQFSTPDADNDYATAQSCAYKYSAGWWFDACYYTCLTCLYDTSDFTWYTLHGLGLEPYGRLRAARMMIMAN